MQTAQCDIRKGGTSEFREACILWRYLNYVFKAGDGIAILTRVEIRDSQVVPHDAFRFAVSKIERQIKCLCETLNGTRYVACVGLHHPKERKTLAEERL